MEDPRKPSPFESTPFTHLHEMIAAFAEATDEPDRRLYLRGIVRALEHVIGKTHEAMEALTQAVSKETE